MDGRAGSPGGADPLPDAAALEGFFEACYQASMLREEERPDPFESQWLPGQFARLLQEFTEQHEAARNRAHELSGERWAPLEPSLPRRITERMMKRVISVLRDARHGGTVIFVPLENTGDLSREHPYIDLRYGSRTSGPDSVSPTS